MWNKRLVELEGCREAASTIKEENYAAVG